MKRFFVAVAAAVLVASMLSMHAQEEVLLKIGCQDEPKTLNIWKATDVWTTHTVNWFYPSLYRRKPVTLEPLPDICTLPYADLLANSPDGLTYTMPLRDDVTWDDGMPLTAYDFEFTYTVIMELEIPDYIPVFEDVEYLKAVDDYTLEIKLAKCSPQFEESVIYHFAVPKQQFEPLLIEARETDVPMQTFLDMAVDKPISAGPFSFGQWEKGAFIKLVTNPDYYGKGRIVDVEGVGTITEGPDYDGLLLKLYGTTDAALLGIQKGEIDFIWWSLDPGYVAQLLGNPDVTIEKSDELGFYYLAPNCAKEPFDDMKLRQAMVYLVQKDFIVNRVLQGYGGEAHSVVMPAAGEWYNDNVNKFGDGMTKDERVAKAIEVLTGAGYTVPIDANGNPIKYPEAVIKLPDGTPMQPFEILTPPADYDPMRAMSGVLIQEWWREIGIPVTAKPTSFGEIVHKTFEAMTFDWYVLGWRIGGAGYPDHMRYFFHSDQAVPDGNNPMGYKNPAVDRALEDLMTLCDHDELVAAAHKAQELIVGEVGYCPLYYRTMNEAHRNDSFEGWFTQLGGIAGTESPRHCLPYLKPITEKPEGTSRDLSEYIEDELEKLVLGHILFNVPEEMKVGVKERIEVRISKEFTQELMEGLKGTGIPQIEEKEIGTFMKVQLRGDNFDIEALSHEEQIVPDEGFTQWEWDVVPKKSGTQTLKLCVFVRIPVPSGKEEGKDIPVIERQINVKVSLKMILIFLETNWKRPHLKLKLSILPSVELSALP